MTQRIEFYFFRASPALAAALAAAWDKLPQARAGIWWRKAEGFYTFLETEDGFGDKVALPISAIQMSIPAWVWAVDHDSGYGRIGVSLMLPGEQPGPVVTRKD
jgi:hypothetical protein